ncbi:MAG: VOC family protein [Mycobacteriales bacterium]
MVTRVQVTFDAADPHALAGFWAEALGYQQEDHSSVVAQLLDAGHLRPDEVIDVEGRQAFRDVATCIDPDGSRPRLLFQRVPEPKGTKNRVHLDLQVGAEAAPAEIERLLALGATAAWVTSDRGPVNTTLRDPEGNEFCVS